MPERQAFKQRNLLTGHRDHKEAKRLRKLSEMAKIRAKKPELNWEVRQSRIEISIRVYRDNSWSRNKRPKISELRGQGDELRGHKESSWEVGETTLRDQLCETKLTRQDRPLGGYGNDLKTRETILRDQGCHIRLRVLKDNLWSHRDDLRGQRDKLRIRGMGWEVRETSKRLGKRSEMPLRGRRDEWKFFMGPTKGSKDFC